MTYGHPQADCLYTGISSRAQRSVSSMGKPLPFFTIHLYLYLKFDVRYDYANANSVRPIVCCNRRHPDHVIAHKSPGDYVIIGTALSLDYKEHTHTHTHTSADGNLNFARVGSTTTRGSVRR